MAPAWLEEIVAAGLEQRAPAAADGLALLASDDELLLDVVAAAARVRRRFFGARVKLNFLVSVKSGGCPEDCGYCSQGRSSEAEILRYPWLEPEAAAELAERAAAAGARRVCLRTAQPLALQIADSIFLGDYLTSEGQAAEADLAMIRDAGLVVEGAAPPADADPRGSAPLRRRGPGTDAAANL